MILILWDQDGFNRCFSLGTLSISNSIYTSLRQNAQPQSSTTENLSSSFSDISLSMGPSYDFESLFTVNSYRTSTHHIGDQESPSPLSITNVAVLPFQSLEETLDFLHLIHIIIHWELITKTLIIPHKSWNVNFFLYTE